MTLFLFNFKIKQTKLQTLSIKEPPNDLLSEGLTGDTG